MQVPLGLDLPYWVEDPDFDIDFHVRQLALPSPGSDEQLAEQVARIVSRPARPQPPAVGAVRHRGTVEGGRIAQLTKLHHATIDGASGAQMLADMLETDPDVRPSGDVADWEPERIPSDAQLLQRTALEYLRRPEKLVRLNVRVLRQLASAPAAAASGPWPTWPPSRSPARLGDRAAPAAAGRQRGRHPAGTAADAGAPHAVQPLDHAPPALRVHARSRLAEAKTVKNALGTTFNDVVMALCSATLRRYLEERDVLPDEPLIAMVPVSIRSGDEARRLPEPGLGRCSCNLATDEKDPVERLMKIHGS